MECPKCNAGRIHVVTLFACCCGHHTLFCDQCFSKFEVSCGPPYDASKLPPKYPIEEIHKEDSEEFVEACRGLLEGAPEECPLLEDFKLSLAGKSS